MSNLYIELFHGRRDPEEEVHDWGTTGPVFGPYAFIHTTYGCDIKLGDGHDDMHTLTVTPESMIFYDGVYYGDWSVFSGSLLESDRGSLRERHTTFVEDLAVPPAVSELTRIVRDTRRQLQLATRQRYV